MSLSIIPTPIGNLGDITLRSLDCIKKSDLLLVEDSRRTRSLLTPLGIKKKIMTFHENNEQERLPNIISLLHANMMIGMMTDAGTPSISDPGFRLIRKCIDEKIPYTVLPGATASITALVASGFPPVPFFFGGFLPNQPALCQKILQKVIASDITSIYFESAHRLLKTLYYILEIAPLITICIAREMTKIYEEYRHGNAQCLIDHYTQYPLKGEITLVFPPLSFLSSPKITNVMQSVDYMRHLF